MRKTIPELDARRLLGGGPVVLVSTAWRGNTNVMPAAFVAPLSFDPPLIGLAVHPTRHTHDMIKYSEQFALNVPSHELLQHCQYLGSVTGRELNKLELTKLPTFRARKVEAPLLEGCLGYIECGVEDAYTTGDHTLFVGKVLAAQAEQEAFEETWLLTDPELKPLHYLGLNYYALLEERLEARVAKAEEEESTEAQVEAGVEQAEAETRERRERGAEEAERRRREGLDEEGAG
jgi:flavin reductase (DIM6/NTAB) family NADH-FMN oxidoreductase RutF